MATKAMMLRLGLAAAAAVAGTPVVTDDNMNGEYLLANTPNATATWSTSFKDCA